MNCVDCGKEANDTAYWSAVFMGAWIWRCKGCFEAMQKAR